MAVQQRKLGKARLPVLAVLMWVLLAIGFDRPGGNPFAMLGLLVGASFIGAGVYAWHTSPRNRIGLLMVMVGIAWLPKQISMGIDQPLHPYVTSASTLWIAVIMHLVVAFPTGRLGSWMARIVAALVYGAAVAIGLAHAYLLSVGWPSGGAPPTTPIRLRSQEALPLPQALATTVVDSRFVAIVVLGVAVLSVVLLRWRSASVTQRRAVAPVYISAAVAITLFIVGETADFSDWTEIYLDAGMLWAFAAIPLAYLAGRMRGRIDRAGVADLVVRLRDMPPRGNLEAGLAAALHDPDLRVAYWMPDQDSYVDADGRPVEVPSQDLGRVITRIDRAGARFAVLLHDPALLEEPALVDAACAAAALALENERLAAELRARLSQLAASRARVLQASEAEQRRLERDLHDGVQQHLLSAAMTLGLAETTLPEDGTKAVALVGEAKHTVLTALEDLRALCQGIHPTVLSERGLPGAVRELTAVASVPVECSVDLPATLPPEVETAAYYIVNEAMANLTKHANATRAWITIRRRSNGADGIAVEVRDDGRGGADADRGTGLHGLADRVEAQRGTFHVSSPLGGGTTIRAELPCG